MCLESMAMSTDPEGFHPLMILAEVGRLLFHPCLEIQVLTRFSVGRRRQKYAVEKTLKGFLP